MSKKPFLILAAVLTLASCGKSNGSSQPSDPVEGMKFVMQKLQSEINSQPQTITPPGDINKWYKRKIYTPQEMQYDVKKTDSIVTPHAGIIDFECNVKVASALTQEDLDKIEMRDFVTAKCRSTWAHQDKKWIFKSMACQNPLNATRYDEIPAGDTSILGTCRNIAIAITATKK